MSVAGLFPGQGAQSVGMLAELEAAYPQVRETFAEASEAVGDDLWRLASEGPAEALNRTRNTQPALLAAGVAAWRVWEAHGGSRPACFAGHSLGEYAALVAAGALPLPDAARLVRRRGELMQAAVPEGIGGMAAVLGLGDGEAREICARLSMPDAVVDAVNFNAPGQVVLSGHRQAVEAAAAACREAGARRAVMLDVSVPSHSSLMQPAAESFKADLAAAPFAAPHTPVLNNVDVRAEAEPERIREALARQLHAPVRWTDGILEIIKQGATVLLEFGPGRVLTGLNRRIDKTVTGMNVESPDTLEHALRETADAE